MTVTADAVGGGSYLAPNTVDVAVLPAAPVLAASTPDWLAYGEIYLTWSGGGEKLEVQVSSDGSGTWVTADNVEGHPSFEEDVVHGLQGDTTYLVRMATFNGAGWSAWSNTPSATVTDGYNGFPPPYQEGMTAYRTGGNYGVPVSDADRLSYDPSKYVILVNDGYGDDPSGQNNNMAYHSSQVDATDAISGAANDRNLAKITFNEAPGASGVQLTVSGAGRGSTRPTAFAWAGRTSSPRPVIGAAPTSPTFPAAT